MLSPHLPPQLSLDPVSLDPVSLSLKLASEEIKEKIYKNMSQRAAQLIAEDMEYMGPVRVTDVEASQQRIVDVVRRLVDAGEIMIAGRGEDMVV